jgi:hypothetical protein
MVSIMEEEMLSTEAEQMNLAVLVQALAVNLLKAGRQQLLMGVPATGGVIRNNKGMESVQSILCCCALLLHACFMFLT